MYINRVDDPSRPTASDKVQRQRRKQGDSRFDDLLDTAIVDSVEITDPDGKKRDASYTGSDEKPSKGADKKPKPADAEIHEEGKGLNVTV